MSTTNAPSKRPKKELKELKESAETTNFFKKDLLTLSEMDTKANEILNYKNQQRFIGPKKAITNGNYIDDINANALAKLKSTDSVPGNIDLGLTASVLALFVGARLQMFLDSKKSELKSISDLSDITPLTDSEKAKYSLSPDVAKAIDSSILKVQEILSEDSDDTKSIGYEMKFVVEDILRDYVVQKQDIQTANDKKKGKTDGINKYAAAAGGATIGKIIGGNTGGVFGGLVGLFSNAFSPDYNSSMTVGQNIRKGATAAVKGIKESTPDLRDVTRGAKNTHREIKHFFKDLGVKNTTGQTTTAFATEAVVGALGLYAGKSLLPKIWNFFGWGGDKIKEKMIGKEGEKGIVTESPWYTTALALLGIGGATYAYQNSDSKLAEKYREDQAVAERKANNSSSAPMPEWYSVSGNIVTIDNLDDINNDKYESDTDNLEDIFDTLVSSTLMLRSSSVKTIDEIFEKLSTDYNGKDIVLKWGDYTVKRSYRDLNNNNNYQYNYEFMNSNYSDKSFKITSIVSGSNTSKSVKNTLQEYQISNTGVITPKGTTITLS